MHRVHGGTGLKVRRDGDLRSDFASPCRRWKRYCGRDCAPWRPAGLHLRRQVPLGPYIVDFACLKARLIVEIDGIQHGDPVHAEKDAIRDRYISAQGFKVLRFWNSQLREDSDSVVATIIAYANAAHSTGS